MCWLKSQSDCIRVSEEIQLTSDGSEEEKVKEGYIDRGSHNGKQHEINQGATVGRHGTPGLPQRLGAEGSKVLRPVRACAESNGSYVTAEKGRGGEERNSYCSA